MKHLRVFLREGIKVDDFEAGDGSDAEDDRAEQVDGVHEVQGRWLRCCTHAVFNSAENAIGEETHADQRKTDVAVRLVAFLLGLVHEHDHADDNHEHENVLLDGVALLRENHAEDHHGNRF